MNSNDQIKNGLFYHVKSVQRDRTDVSILQRNKESISLTYIFSGVDGTSAGIKNVHSHSMTFVFHNDYLENFAAQDEVFSFSRFPEYQEHELCCTTQMILHELIQCSLQGVYRNMFIESKALALFVCSQKNTSIENTPCASCKFLTRPIEKEKITRAKEILLGSLQNPPTIPELSLLIGINQCYLKKGFKELFGMTVYDFVQEQRMQKAKLLLTTAQYSVSEVAEQIGYSSQSNFSSAFKKFTGIFPSAFQQN